MSDTDPLPIYVGMSLSQAERVLISSTLEHTDYNVAMAAIILGIDRSTLYAKLKRYGIGRYSSSGVSDGRR